MGKSNYALTLFLFALLSIAPALHSQGIVELYDSNSQLKEIANGMLDDLPAKSMEWLPDELAPEKTIIIKGSKTDAIEKALLDSAKGQVPSIENAAEIPDSEEAMAELESGRYTFAVLIGGPYQNSITKKMLDSGTLDHSDELHEYVLMRWGTTENGVRVLAVSDRQGFSDLGREGINYSPLLYFLPPEYVPAGATIISLILLALINVARTVYEFKALNIGRKGKKLDEPKLMLFGRNVAEIAAIAGASVVLGISISWQFFGPSPDFAKWVAINSIICFISGISHETTHRIFARLFKIKVEYRFWPAGSGLTLVSSYLGNAFSIQGFLLEEIPEKTDKWKVGLMKLSAPILSTFIMLAFAAINFFSPDRLYQAIYSISALWAMAEMLPFSGLDGKDIIEWNRLVWAVAFAFVAVSYIAVTFVL